MPAKPSIIFYEGTGGYLPILTNLVTASPCCDLAPSFRGARNTRSACSLSQTWTVVSAGEDFGVDTRPTPTYTGPEAVPAA